MRGSKEEGYEEEKKQIGEVGESGATHRWERADRGPGGRSPATRTPGSPAFRSASTRPRSGTHCIPYVATAAAAAMRVSGCTVCPPLKTTPLFYIPLQVLLSAILPPVAEDMRMMDLSIKSIIGERSPLLLSAAEQIFGAGGKRVRPMLVFLVARATAQLAGMPDLAPEHRRLAEITEVRASPEIRASRRWREATSGETPRRAAALFSPSHNPPRAADDPHRFARARRRA